jgi:cytochrome c-type biogenesis protein CcmH
MTRRIHYLCVLVPACLALFPVLAAAHWEPLADPALEREAKEIENLLIAPCCWRQAVAVHYSPAADRVRAEVREMLASGLGRQEILERYIAEHGERILSKPPASGFNLLAYFLPVLFLVGGAGLAMVVVRRLRPKKKAEKASTSEAPSPARSEEYSRQLNKEMWG